MHLTSEKVLSSNNFRKTSIFTYGDSFKAIYKAGNFDVEALSRIKNNALPHFVKILRFDEHNMLTEFIEGCDLDHVNLRTLDTNSIILQLCDALIALHRLGIAHFDIQPENIMINNTGEIFVVDLEFASCLDNGALYLYPCKKCPYYAAPEFMSTGVVDYRSDIYSLGATIERIILNDSEKSQFQSIVERCKNIDPSCRYDTVEKVKEDILNVIYS